MGAFLDQIRNKKINVDKQLLNASGSKLREYFCSYRSICENFSISIPQYMQIFGSNVKSFNVWDPHRQGFINAMQIFSGLFVFSRMAYEDKIKFLYQFFDLNEQGYLSYDDLAFMFISVYSATCKIYQLQLEVGENLQKMIQKYLDEFFSQETKLEYNDFIRWSYRNEELIEYFQIIGHPFKPQINKHTIDQYDQNNLVSQRYPFIGTFNMKKQSKLKIKIDQRFLNILKNDHILLQEEQNHEEFNPVMKWVYGIRVDDIRYPLHYRKTEHYKAANEKFLYICGKNVVVLYPKLNVQKNYTGHAQSISCIQIASCQSIVASGEMGHNPSIHIWSLKNAKCLQKFSRIHKHSIKMLKFTKNNQLLITLSQKLNNPLVILNIRTKQKILSTYLPQPALNILHLKPNSKESQNEFYMTLPSFVVKCSSTDGIGYEMSYHKILAFAGEKSSEESKIQTAAVLNSKQESLIVAISQNNKVALFNPFTKQSELIDNSDIQRSLRKSIGTNKQIKLNSHSRQQKIVDIFPSSLQNRMYCLFRKSFKVYQISNQNLKCIGQVKYIPKELYNLEFVQLIEVNENCVILISLMGDVIKVSNFLNSFENNKQIESGNRNLKFCQPIGNSIKIHKQDVDEEELGSQQDNSIIQSEGNEDIEVIFQKYYQIFKMEKIVGVCFLAKEGHQVNPQTEKQQLLVASNSMIYLIDQVQKQLLSLQCLDQKITHIHSFGNTYAVATQLKYIFVLKNGVTLQKAKCNDNGITSNSVVNGLKMTGDNLIIAIDQFIEVYFKSGGNYLGREPKRIKIQHGIPIHISMTSIAKVFLIVTRQSREKSILKLNAQPKQKNPVLTAKQLNCDFLQTFYPESNGMKAPILFSGIKGMFLVAQPNGDIYYWNSLNHMINSQQSYSLLSGHCSPISELVFSGKGFISAGSQDGQVITWNNTQVLCQHDHEDEDSQEEVGSLAQKSKKGRIGDEHYNQVNKIRQQNPKIVSNLYIDELKSLSKFVCDKLQLKDSQIQVIVKGSEIYKDISKNINNILIPKNLQMFEPLAQKKKVTVVEYEKKNSKKLQKTQANSTLNFKCLFVYGFSSEQTRQSLFYIHHYPQTKARFAINFENANTNYRQKSQQIQYAKEQLLPINDTHLNCRRSFLYFTCRMGVIWSPVMKTQFQYDFHINRITCAAVHPNKILVCTGQVSYPNALIHLWSTDLVTMIRIFKTRHKQFVSRIQFSRDGNFFVSLGGPPYQQSIQIHNLIREESICFKYIEDTCFYDIKYNPYNCNEIAACGYKSLWILGVSNHTIIKKEEAVLGPNEEVTCMVYTSSVYGNTIQSDIITGNAIGDLSLFICGKYIVCKKAAHERSINCIKLCELFGYRTVVITASEDNFIKIWDTKFNQISKINIKQILLTPKTINDTFKMSIAPQSIDVYQCFNTDSKNNSQQKVYDEEDTKANSQTLLLVGTRNGCILEVKICNEYQGLKQYDSKSSPLRVNQRRQDFYAMQLIVNKFQDVDSRVKETNATKISQKVQLNYITHFNNLPSAFHRSVKFDIKNNLMVTYSKANLNIVLWNIEKRQMLKVHKLSSHPSVIKFTKTNCVAVGYVDGRIQFFDLGNAYTLTLREQKVFFDVDYLPVQIICSQNDVRIAVVYTKEYQQKRASNSVVLAVTRDESLPMEGEQVIMVYEKIISNNNLGHIYVMNEKNTQRIQNEKRKFRNVYWCDFNAEGNKLLICYTLNDYLSLSNVNRKRIMSSFQSIQHQPLYEYSLYDLVKKIDREFTNEEFNVLNFSPAVRAKYHYYSECSIVEESSISDGKTQDYDKNSFDIERKFKMNMTFKDQSNKSSLNQHSSLSSPPLNNLSQIDQIGPVSSNSVNAGSIGSELKEEYVPICQMAQYQKFTLMGTIYGQIFAIKSEFFYSDGAQEQGQSQIKSVKAKCFACHDSPITNMQVVGNKLFVSAKDCSTVIQYEMIIEEKTGKLNMLIANTENKLGQKTDSYKSQTDAQVSKYYETFTLEKVQNWLKYVFPKRKNFYELKLNCFQKKHPKEDLFGNEKKDDQNQLIMEPYHIIGRNAFYKRNNVLIDLKDNLITFSGCNLLIMSPSAQNKNEYKQQFLKLDNSIFTVNPEISTITLSIDKRTLYAGTTEENCQVIIWDISTRTELQHICFKDYVSIILIKVSQLQRHLVVLALSKEAKQVIFFISLIQFEILASFCVQDEAQICDLEFVPGNQFKFLACGYNYMAQWSLKGGFLSCEKYSMRNPKDFIDHNIQNSNKSAVIFYSIIFLKDVAITGASDGYLYMWNDRNLIKKQNANPKAAILSLYSSKNSKIFASGAVDGKAIVWQLGASSIIQKVFQFNIYSGKDSIIPSKFHIQSVNIGKNEIFIGTRSGQIHRFQFTPSQNTQNEQSNISNKQNYQSILSAYDNDHINSCSFNISSQKLYVLTQSGIFSVFNLLTNEKIKEQKIKIDNQQIVKMLACKLSNKIYIVMKKGIDVYTYTQDGKHSNKFSKSKDFFNTSNSQIKVAILSLNQKYLALLMSPNHLENAKIQIYDLTQQDGKQFYVQHKVLENIPANIEIIDFSTDNGYLVYKNSDEDETIIDLTTKQLINTNMIQFELQWNEQAKKTSKYIRDICSTYSDENKLRTILQIMNHSVLATDEMGSVRLFHYEQNIEENTVEYYRIYLQHLNDVYLCILSSDCSILVTVGSYDRSIIIWKIKNFDMLTSKRLTVDKKLSRTTSKKLTLAN